MPISQTKADRLYSTTIPDQRRLDMIGTDNLGLLKRHLTDNKDRRSVTYAMWAQVLKPVN